MNQANEIVPFPYSITTPAVPLTYIMTYFKCHEQYDLNTLEVVSVTRPVVAICVRAGTDYKRNEETNRVTGEGELLAVVLSEGHLSWRYHASDAKLEKDGWTQGWHRLCLTSDVDQQRKEAEEEFTLSFSRFGEQPKLRDDAL
jgi:hypothetical protein